MEKCVECESVYELEESNSNQKSAFCSLECEIKFVKRMYKPMEFMW